LKIVPEVWEALMSTVFPEVAVDETYKAVRRLEKKEQGENYAARIDIRKFD
jgi:hypothetical protein